MAMNFLKTLREHLRPETVYAHCDIPCGIYDPHLAQVSAHTVVRMMDLIHDVQTKEGSDLEKRNSLVRYVATKEESAELVKHEVRIIWGDYFKDEHLKDHPDLHTLVWKIMKQAGKCRQSIDKKAAQDLLDSVNKFSEIFWKTKGKDTQKAKAAYPTEKEILLPKLG
jgi:nickel superoxide dismutase